MSYTKFYNPANDNDPSTPVSAAFANHVEDGIVAAAAVADAAIAKSVGTTAGDIIYFTGSGAPARLALSATGVLKGGASAPSWGTIVNADVDVAAAIAIAKLAGYPSDATKVLHGDGSWTVLSSGPTITYATTPPGSPATGDIWYWVDSTTTPTRQWTMRWNGGSSNTDKWEFVGGAPAFIFIDTDESTTSTTYVDLTTVGPQFTMPRGGVYDVDWAYHGYGGITAYSTLKVGAAAAADSLACSKNFSASLPGDAVSRPYELTVAASDVVKAMYRAASAGTIHFYHRALKVQPKRVS